MSVLQTFKMSFFTILLQPQNLKWSICLISFFLTSGGLPFLLPPSPCFQNSGGLPAVWTFRVLSSLSSIPLVLPQPTLLKLLQAPSCQDLHSGKRTSKEAKCYIRTSVLARLSLAELHTISSYLAFPWISFRAEPTSTSLTTSQCNTVGQRDQA